MNYLTYINGLGPDYKGNHVYEFIFSETLEVTGENWDKIPAHGYPTPPNLEYIQKVGSLKNSNVKLELVQNSDVFGMEEAVDKIIALGWETESSETKDRLVFAFGDSEKDIKDKLYSRDILLEFEKEMKYEID